MKKSDFLPGTSFQTSVELTMQALAIIAAGWPVFYIKPAALAGAPNQVDLDAMVRDAVSLAAKVQEAAADQCPAFHRGEVDVAAEGGW